MVGRGTNRKGFTLVEVIIVLVVLAVLAAIMIPALTGWVDESKARICASNRLQILRYYQYEDTLYYLDDTNKPTLTAVLNGEYAQSKNDVKGLTCPSGGKYSAVGNAGIYCDVHGFEAGMPQDVLISAMQAAGVSFGPGSGYFTSSASYIDSTAPKESTTTKASTILKWLGDHGVQMEKMNIQAWKLQGASNSKTVRLAAWTDQDVTKVSVNDYVRVICYDANPGGGNANKTYTVGYVQVESAKVGGGTTYHRMADAYAESNKWYDKSATQRQFATYEEALAYYNQLEATQTK